METPRTCPSCRKPLPSDVPLGLCPECLIKSGFSTGTEPGAEGNKGFVPPAVSEIAKLFPQFEIISLLGKGGMGAVYKARQPGLDRLVALKILPPHVADDPGFVERFNREARALARLSHPNIVAVYDFGKVNPPAPEPPDAGKPSTPLCYLLMEFVDGMNLREVERAGRLTPEQALQIVPQICEALQFAHNEGVVHRDIKPENILLDKKGRVKITDFGIAKIIGLTPEKVGLTGVKDIVGTPHYMAPEQVERPNTVDHRADIYSLGVVFYELLTGELPIGKFASPSSKVQMDVRLDEVVLRALEKEPERRYQQVSQVKTAVETIVGTPPVFPSSKPPAVPVIPQPSQPINPRCSLTAIIGMVWSVFFIFAFLGMLSVRATQAGPGSSSINPSVLMIILGIIFVPLGFTAPFGTTILGWIAVGQIRRSAGRIYGLAMAVFDGLVFPLLLVDGVIGWVWSFVGQFIHSLISTPGNFGPLPAGARLFIENQRALVMSFTLVTVAVIDFLVIWLAWRAVKTPVQNTAARAEIKTPRSQPGGGLGTAVAAIAVVGIIVLAAVFGVMLLMGSQHPTTASTPAVPEPPGYSPATHRPQLPPWAQPRRPKSPEEQSQPLEAAATQGRNASPQPKPAPKELSATELQKVLADLKSLSPALQRIAAAKLAEAKAGDDREEVEGLLLGMLDSRDWPTRRAAAAALGVWGTDKAFEPLVKALDDFNLSVRWAAINSLAAMKNAKAAEPLAKHMADSEDIQPTANALQSMGPLAEDFVIPLMQHKNPDVRYAACRVLKAVGTSKSVPALTTAAGDSDGIAAMLAQDALRTIAGRK